MEQNSTGEQSSTRRVVAPQGSGELPQDVLVVVSKLKDYIQKKGGMNTSGTVAAVLSDKIRALCDAAIEHAASDGRKTVMDRDFVS